MMGNQKLCLLLLLGTCTFAQQGDDSTEDQGSSCLKEESRFKHFKKYIYQYEAESLNGVAGTAALKNSPKVTCKAELEVPQSCSFILRTSDCSLSEVIDPQSKLSYRPAPNTDDFKAAMAKYDLKFRIQGGDHVSLYPDSGEPENILNMKRGIITALMAPMESNEKIKTIPMDTVYGKCDSELTVNTRKADTSSATDITVTRDLVKCQSFNPMRGYVSPLALITGMNTPLSTLISSSQSCKYVLDKRRHVTDATCTEKHVFLPFSHKEYGIMSQVKQTLKFVDVVKINNRYFDQDESAAKPLTMDYAEDKSPVQTKEATLEAFRALQDLPGTQQGQQRASLFYKLVNELRGLNNKTLSEMVPEMTKMSSSITLQALPQCGTPECIGAALQVLRFIKAPTPVVDAVTYSLGLLPSPCHKRVRETLNMAQYQQSRATLYALSHTVRKFYNMEHLVTPEVTDVAEFMTSLLGSDCSGNEDHIYLTLKAIGNMGKAMEDAHPNLKSTVLKCVQQPSASLAVQQAAIQAFRQMTITDEVRSILLRVFQENSGKVQKRVAAYLMLMKQPSQSDLSKVSKALLKERNEQVKSFVASHIANILESEDPSVQELKRKVEEALKGNQLPDAMDFRKFSRNYHVSHTIPDNIFGFETLRTTVGGNMIFDPTGYMPREAMLETTLQAFGNTIDMFEFGLDGNGFEPSLDALFGEKGFFPDSALKAMYWVNNKLPERVSEVLKNWFGHNKDGRTKREIPEDIIKEVTDNAKKLMKDLKSQNSPEATAYLRILGTELGYLKMSDFNTVAEMIMNFGKELQGLPIQLVKAVTSGTDMDLFAHYIFMDNEFSLPTGAGLPLKFSLSGVFTPGARAGLKIDPKTKQLTFRPSLSVEFITQMGVQIPEFNTNGIQMHTNIYHESGVNAKVSIKGEQVKLSIPAPQGPTQLFSISNTLLSVSSGQTDIVPPIVERRTDTVTCNPMFPGLQFCTTVRYSNASMTDAAPYYPLTGETRLAFEIQPTGEVTEYSATIAYELLKEDRDKVDTVKLTVKAEGSQGSEATATMKYNRNKMTFSSDLQIPDYDVQVGINVGVKDEGMFKGKKTYGLNIGVSNKNVPELTLLGRVRFEGMKEGQISAQLTIPRINVEGKTSATVHVANGLTVQLDATANIPESSSAQRVILRYDNDKAELEMKSDIHSDLKKLLPDFSHYQNSIQKYTDDILDQKVAKTDMKLRHIVSKSIEAGNIWLNKIAKDLPYVENLINKQSLLDLTLPSIPEKLYLKTDSLIRYQFNKNKLTFEVDLPLGGKTSQELNLPNTFYTPPLVFPEVGINVPSKEFSIPSFTIPKTQEIRLPLLGVAELSTKLTSNYYNWTASFIGGNNTQDNMAVVRYIAKYQVKAEAPVDLFCYNVEGTGLKTSDSHGVFTTSMNGSLQHSLLEASVSYSDYANFEDLSSRVNYHFGASSVLGVKTSLSYTLQNKFNEIGFKGEEIVGGHLEVGPLYGNSTTRTIYSFNKDWLERRMQSSTKLDSSFLEASNRMTCSYVNEELSFISNTDVNSGALVHVGEISYKDGVLNVKSDANGRHKSISALNKIEISLSGQIATMRVESQAQHLRNRVFALISGSLNGRGLELNADGTINVAESRGAHKATLTINPNGLATSATTSLQCSAVIFSNVFNGGIDASGATLSLVTKGSDIKNTAELTVDGKVGSSEVYLNSVYKGNIMDANSRNRLNFKVNKEGLAFSNNMMGSYNKIKAEHTNTLNIALWSIAFTSKTDNLLGAGNSYKHDFKFDLKPFIISLSLNNDLKFLGVDFTNEGKLKLEPLNLNLNGNVRGAYGKDQELKHTYTINYAELAGTVECSTTGRVWGAQVDNAVKLEVAALSSKFHSDTKLSCKSLRFDNVIRTLVKPFKVSVEAVTNGDGSLNLYGTHSGQLYSKFLMKAEPLAVTYLHDYRGSTTHQLETGGPASTLLDNKVNGLVTPSEQSSTWKLKTQLNKNTYTQDVIAYNKAEKIGIELAGHILTDILPIFASSGRSARDVSGQPQEFSISGFLKYDKNKDLHIIELPFVESLPAVIEQIKANMVNALESLQKYLKSLKLNDLVRKYKASLDKLPQQVNDYMKRLDLESKVNDAKKQLMVFTKDYTVTIEDLERYLERVKELYQEALTDLQEQLNKLEMMLKAYDPIEWKQAIEKLISKIVKTLRTIDQQYEITRTAMSTISVMQDIIQKYDLNKLKDSSTAWLQNLDEKYQIKAELQKALDKLKDLIQNFDVQKIAEDLVDCIKSINIEDAINSLKTSFPTDEINRVMETIKDVVLNWIEEYEIAEKINSAYAKLQELLVKYEIDKKLQVLMDKSVLLVQQYKVKETVQSAVNVLKSIDLKSYVDTMQQSLDDVIKQLKAQDYKQIIEQLNAYIDMLLQKIKSFNYNTFVDETNKKIGDMTKYVNSQIKDLEIPQKIESAKQYIRDIQTAAISYLEQLKDTRLAEVITWCKDLMDSTALTEVKKRIQENLEDLRNRISTMDIQKEVKLYLQRASDFYNRFVNFMIDQWNNAYKNISTLAEQYDVKNAVDRLKKAVEEGVTFPESIIGTVRIPAFELSLNALKKAEFETPEFTVPLTDLQVPSFKINLKKLQEISIPTRFTVPEFSVLDIYIIPSHTIDLEEIKKAIIRAVDRIRNFQIELPEPDIYFRELKIAYLSNLPDLTFPEVKLSEINFPEIRIPKLNNKNFQFPELQIPEFHLPRIPHEVSIPTFGKLSGEFKIKSPYYTLTTTAEVRNATASQMNPEITASVTSEATSSVDYLAFTLDATAHLSAPEMKSLKLIENVKFNNKFFSLDHNSKLIFSGKSVLGTAETTAKATTEAYSAEAVNNLRVSLERGVSVTMHTKYTHNLNIPEADISSQTTLDQNVNTRLESGTVSVTVSTTGSGKWSVPDYSDDGTHKSDLEFTVNFNTAKLTFTGQTNSKFLKMKQTITLESVILNHINVDIRAETETPFVKSSVFVLNGKAQVSDMKIELGATHNAVLVGRVSGKVINSVGFSVKPFEISLTVNNDGNTKISLPLKLTGKIDLKNNYALILTSKVQLFSWVAGARFNQYKYSHNVNLGNSDDSISVNLAMNGEANLEFLNTPVTIPEIKIPYTSMKTRLVKDVSLWQDTGLKNLLLTPRQSFDLTFRVQYQKNKDMHSYSVNLEPVYSTINDYVIETFNQNFEVGRDKVVTLLTNSYNKAKEQYRKLKIDTSVNKMPKAFRIPGYTVPVLNIEVSPFMAELPEFGFVIPKEVSTPGFTVPMIGFSMPSYTLVLPSLELPVLHVPATLQKLTLPKFKVPRTQDTILVPAMGNITYDFAFKSAVITLNANAGIYNQSDITARFSASSSSVFDILNFKLDGTTSLTRQRGLKLATALSLNHQNIEGAHDSTLGLTKRFIDASVTTTSKVKLPGLNLEFKQELKGNSKSKPNVASKINLKYNFKVPQIDTNGKGTVDHTLSLEGLTSYFSLDTTTKGNIEGIFLTTNTFSGKINNEASTYLNSNGIRSTIKTNANSKVDSKKSKIWNFDLNENLALEASPLRLYAMWNHTGSNEAIISSFNTKGNQAAKAILELVPTSMKADLQLAVSQPSSLVEEASIHHTVTVNINSENQKLGWNGKEQFMSKILAHDFLLSNDDSEVRFDVTGSVQGHVTFLKDITLPIYKKSIWEILRLDLTTSEDKLQYLNGSTTIVYTKNKDGYFFPLPINVLADGVTINIPEVTLQIPKWVRNLPRKIREIDIPIENFKIPERVSIPSVIVTPAFKVPLTTLQLPSYTIDFKKIKIPKKISLLSFDLTLPHLPKVKFPKVDIAAQYLNAVKSKLPQFSVAVPDFNIIISSFTLPKTFTVGSHVIEMDKVVNQIANFDLPTITIPEQKIEIPEISVSLPAGLFIPVFGALSTTVKVASPVYNMSWTTSLENKTSSMVSSVKSTCSSTVMFLEYDLEASATTSYQDGAFKLDGKCTLSHNDLSIEWRHAYNLKNQRMKRQALPDPRPKHHLLNVDITSPTFADVSIRYAAGLDVITASVASPSAGFLGLLLEKTGPERIHGKLYSRYPSFPENDVDLLDAIVSVKNPEKLHVEAFWNRDGPYFMLEGLTQRIPKMASAVYSCINKYHRQLFGMDINRLSLMLKDNIQNYIETVSIETSKKIDELERGLHNMVKYAFLKYEQMNDKTKNIYKRAANMAKVDLQDLSSKFYDASIDLIREYQKKINDLLDATIKFLRVTKFQMPGLNQRYTGQELFNKAADSASVMIDKFLQQVKNVLQQYTDALIKYINDMEIKVPGTDKILQGKEVLDSIKDYLRKVQNEVVDAVKSLRKVNLEKSLQKLKDFFKTSFMQVEEVIKALKTKNLEEIKVQVQGMYNDAINSPLTAQIKYALDLVVDSVTYFYEFTQTCLKHVVEELEKSSRYVKSLQEEYLDANMVGWTVKYYEIEEKMIELVKSCAEYVKETGPKYIEQFIAYVTQLTEKLKELVGKQGAEYLNYAKDLLIDADGSRIKKISELSNKAEAQIREWSTLAKNIATEYRDHTQVKLQEAYGNLSLDKLTSEAERLFDIIIQQYSAYYQAILEILKELNNNIQPYIQYRDEKLQLDVPLPFLWEHFDELPKRKER
ncbi:apolipoprotein B-100-like isoform X2 [Polyodon spathula]|uniref:apolipoprotein B-100-like isoform X2 n=1 Tax=Polyodon spathula TaxID=7913 RepID=UPI001B7F433E|nr:apolipoprotein B-100-like isoform X2 [Polyodon spathula]